MAWKLGEGQVFQAGSLQRTQARLLGGGLQLPTRVRRLLSNLGALPDVCRKDLAPDDGLQETGLARALAATDGNLPWAVSGRVAAVRNDWPTTVSATPLRGGSRDSQKTRKTQKTLSRNPQKTRSMQGALLPYSHSKRA